MKWVRIVALLAVVGVAVHQLMAGSDKPSHEWPPRVGQPYPDLELLNHKGQTVSLSSYKGKLILIEPIGLSCPACNAFAGGNEHGVGGFRGVRPQTGLDSMAKHLPRYSPGVRIDDPRLVIVQLLLYGMDMQAPSLEDAQAWAKHFDIDTKPNHVVLIGDSRYVNPDSYNMIPGFQLIDGNFVLRADSTGHQPADDLYRHLLPRLGNMIRDMDRKSTQAVKIVKPKRVERIEPKEQAPQPVLTVEDAPTFADVDLIKQAYASIPHRRTVFNFDVSDIDDAHEVYLKAVFHVTEQATVLRVGAYHRYVRYAPRESPELERMGQLIYFMRRLTPPQSLNEFHEHLLVAIKDQKAFYEQWGEEGFGFQYAQSPLLSQHPRVQNASKRLRQAYQILMRNYPRETLLNKQAFFDYLCALDFI